MKKNKEQLADLNRLFSAKRCRKIVTEIEPPFWEDGKFIASDSDLLKLHNIADGKAIYLDLFEDFKDKDLNRIISQYIGDIENPLYSVTVEGQFTDRGDKALNIYIKFSKEGDTPKSRILDGPAAAAIIYFANRDDFEKFRTHIILMFRDQFNIVVHDDTNAKESINTSMLPFIEELLETKVLRSTDDLQNRSSHDLADLIFLTVLALNIIKYYNNTFSSNYARGTTMFHGFDGIRSAGTDLHNYIAVVDNVDRFREKLKKPSAVLSVPKLQLTTHLNTIGRGIINDRNNGVLLALQQELKITNSNYKSIRRLVQDWHRTMPKEKAHAITRLLQAFKFKAPNADIFKPLEAVAKMQHLELKDVLNPEKNDEKG